MAIYTGAAWVATAEAPAVFSQLGVSATPDATNRLSVSSPATLLNNAGAGHQVKVNKATAGDTASLLFQTGFSGRAEMGTAGGDDFSIKVSADGTTFRDGVVLDRSTGRVKVMNGLKVTPAAGDLAGPVDGEVWYNSTTAKFRAQQNGVSVDVVGGSTSVFSDAVFALQDNGDATKQAQFELSAVTTGTVRALTVPDASGTLVLAGAAQTLTNKTIALASNTITGLGALATASSVNLSSQATGTLQAAQEPAHSGDVTNTAGSLALTIAAGAVSNAKLAQVATATIKGRTTAGTGDTEDLTAAQTTALLIAFTTTVKGLVPAPVTATGKVLKDDGTWAAPPAAGATTQMQFNNAGVLAGATDVLVESNRLRLPTASSTTAPAAGGVLIVGRLDTAGRTVPAFISQDGVVFQKKAQKRKLAPIMSGNIKSSAFQIDVNFVSVSSTSRNLWAAHP